MVSIQDAGRRPWPSCPATTTLAACRSKHRPRDEQQFCASNISPINYDWSQHRMCTKQPAQANAQENVLESVLIH